MLHLCRDGEKRAGSESDPTDLAPGDHADDVLGRLAPIGYKHINMRGILTFDLTRYGSSLLHRAPQAAQDRASS